MILSFLKKDIDKINKYKNNKNNQDKNDNMNRKIIKSKSASILPIKKKSNKKLSLKINRYNSENKVKTPKKIICEKFKKNPQFFYTENLCDLVLKSLDLNDKNNDNKEKENKNNDIEKNKNINDKTNESILKEVINLQAYLNLKKYFEENKFDEE